jgi:hypothetical protein
VLAGRAGASFILFAAPPCAHGVRQGSESAMGIPNRPGQMIVDGGLYEGRVVNGEFFPRFYGNEEIKLRIPYRMPGELIIPTGTSGFKQFASGTFLHNTELPHEIHHVKLHAAMSPTESPFTPVANPAPSIDEFWRVHIKAQSINEDLEENAPEIVAALKDDATGMWDWKYPFTIGNNMGFVVAAQSELPAPFALRCNVDFIGYLIVTQPANERNVPRP